MATHQLTVGQSAISQALTPGTTSVTINNAGPGYVAVVAGNAGVIAVQNDKRIAPGTADDVPIPVGAEVLSLIAVDQMIGASVSAVEVADPRAPSDDLSDHVAQHTAMGGFATAAQGGKADTALQPVVAGAGIAGGGFAKHALVTGGAAGAHAAAGIKTGDEIDEVIYFVGAGVAVTDILDLTAEFTITGADAIDNTAGTDTTGGKLIARWTKKTT